MSRVFDPSKFEPFESERERLVDLSEQKSTVNEVFANDENSKWKIDRTKYLIDLSKKYPEIEYTLKINGIATFPKGNLQAIKAKAKNGKTHLNICLMIASLCGKFLAIESQIDNPKVCYFATEEHISSVANLNKKVHRLCSWDTENSNMCFLAYSLREAVIDERVALIEQEIIREEPVIVFIDGIRDLLINFNDIQESIKIINWLMQLSSKHDCAIVCVLHTNKSYSDYNMRGHLGTELLNKSSDVFEVEKKDKNFIVRHSDSRNLETGEWSFCFDEDGLLKEGKIQDKAKGKKDKGITVIEEHFSKILSESKVLCYSELKKKYSSFADIALVTAEKHIEKMTNSGYLKKREDGKYELANCTELNRHDNR